MYYGVTKYIVMRDRAGVETPFIFPNHFVHADLGRRLYGEPVAAGFIYLLPDCDVVVKGRSESLNLDNRGEVDVKLIKEALGW